MDERALPRVALEGLNRLLHPLDAFFRVKPQQSSPPPLFIIGAPRSGTTLTYQLLTQHFKLGYMTAPVAYTCGVANLSTRALRPWLGRPKSGFESHYGQITGIFSPSEHHNYWARWFPETVDLGHYSDPYTADMARFEGLETDLASLSAILERPLIFKNLYLSISAGLVARILPHARFLIIKRDPLLVCQSILRRREQLPDPRKWWSVKPPHYRAWLDLPLWQQVARQVFYANALPSRDLACFARGRFTEVDYVEVCRQPRVWLDRMEGWLGSFGYRTYSKSRIPDQFPVSDRLAIAPTTAKEIRCELADLEGEVHARVH
ncbi:sulfotransferase family protein [Thiohalocapsa marina]|uniref:sulfotransferase family protein n=1 Tax=Thiohalocapsa marina TaxID=424902 RepID=UPI0036DAC322